MKIPIGIEDHIDLLVEEGNVHKLQQLAHEPDKATAKYARKGLHILRTRGFKAPVPPRRPQVVLPSGQIAGSLAGLDMTSPTLASDAAAALPMLAAMPGMILRRRRKKVEP